MRLRSPTAIPEGAALPEEFEFELEDHPSNKVVGVFEIRTVSSHAAVKMIAEGWVPVERPNREEEG